MKWYLAPKHRLIGERVFKVLKRLLMSRIFIVLFTGCSPSLINTIVSQNSDPASRVSQSISIHFSWRVGSPHHSLINTQYSWFKGTKIVRAMVQGKQKQLCLISFDSFKFKMHC